MLEDPENSLGHVVHDDIQINFIRFVALSIEGMLEGYDVRMIEFLHYLQFSIFISFVLIHFFYSYMLTILHITSFVNDSE